MSYVSKVGPLGLLSSTTAFSVANTAVYIQSITVSTITDTQRFYIDCAFNHFINAASYEVSATIGRGFGAGPPTTSYTNLANNVAFATTEIALADAAGEQDNMNTFLGSAYVKDANQANTMRLSFIDQPGVISTYTYAVRITGSTSVNPFFIRQNYMNVLKISE